MVNSLSCTTMAMPPLICLVGPLAILDLPILSTELPFLLVDITCWPEPARLAVVSLLIKPFLSRSTTLEAIR